MAMALEIPRKTSWMGLAWIGLLVLVCYAPVLRALVINWTVDEDMGHGYFVPVIAGFIIWQRREELQAIKPRPSWWGLPLVLMGGATVVVATMGVEVFLGRFALLLTLTGIVWLLGGMHFLRRMAFPLVLLFFMIPIPAIVYNRITLPLQDLATRLAASNLDMLSIPVFREGNILELSKQRLQVVEACSGIRSLLSLTFLSLVYGYFCEKKTWIRWTLFFSTIPIAILANGSRVTFTGILGQINPAYAEGFFHESTGWVIFMIALFIMVMFHQLIRRVMRGAGPRPAA
jgi:exosortase